MRPLGWRGLRSMRPLRGGRLRCRRPLRGWQVLLGGMVRHRRRRWGGQVLLPAPLPAAAVARGVVGSGSGCSTSSVRGCRSCSQLGCVRYGPGRIRRAGHPRPLPLLPLLLFLLAREAEPVMVVCRGGGGEEGRGKSCEWITCGALTRTVMRVEVYDCHSFMDVWVRVMSCLCAT